MHKQQQKTNISDNFAFILTLGSNQPPSSLLPPVMKGILRSVWLWNSSSTGFVRKCPSTVAGNLILWSLGENNSTKEKVGQMVYWQITIAIFYRFLWIKPHKWIFHWDLIKDKAHVQLISSVDNLLMGFASHLPKSHHSISVHVSHALSEFLRACDSTVR